MKASKETLAQELALASLIASGDQAAFEKLYSATHRKVFSICYRMTKDPELAEDLCQQTYIQIWKKIGKFRGQSRLSTWIHRIAVNEALMHFRKAHVRHESKYTESESTEVQFALERYAAPSNEDLRIDLEKAIGQLPKGYFQVFTLKEIEGLEHTEIAQTLGTSEGTSKSQLSKAREKMKRLLNRKVNPKIYPSLAEGLH
ncbi:RNA polymerase sigma factor [bacterium]|nr:MAG: RNA polymerase sigma factor [bacterium]